MNMQVLCATCISYCTDMILQKNLKSHAWQRHDRHKWIYCICLLLQFGASIVL